jgi:Mrp family chromosome partitioning ATPase
MQTTGIPKLAFIASGPLPPNAADLLGSARVFSLLSIGSEVFDLIVVDGPPVLGIADAQLLSSATAATVFTVGAGQARTGLIRGALKRLQLSRSPVIGVVLTKFDNKTAGYSYGYDYSYTYGYGAGSDKSRDTLQQRLAGLTVRPGASTPPPQLADSREST